jgi:hypothetical protein
MNMKNVTAELRIQSDCSGVQFVLTELDVALSFLDIAERTSNAQRQWRLYMRAKNAHTTIRRFIPRCTFSAAEASIVNRKLERVRDRLQRRGILSAAA